MDRLEERLTASIQAAGGDRLPCPLPLVALRRAAMTGRGAASRLARECDVSRETAARWLADAGLLAPDPLLTADVLHAAYVCQGQSAQAIARRFGVGKNRVLRALAAARIETRPRQGSRPPARTRVDEHDLRARYVEQRHSLESLAEHYGLSRYQLQRRLRDAGLTKRRGSHAPRRAAADRAPRATRSDTVARLYADPSIVATLTAHGVEIPAWRDWQPPSPWHTYAAMPLDADLLAALYHDLGLSTRHIGAVCGVSAALVRTRMRQLGMARRPPGSSAPWATRRRRH